MARLHLQCCRIILVIVFRGVKLHSAIHTGLRHGQVYGKLVLFLGRRPFKLDGMGRKRRNIDVLLLIEGVAFLVCYGNIHPTACTAGVVGQNLHLVSLANNRSLFQLHIFFINRKVRQRAHVLQPIRRILQIADIPITGIDNGDLRICFCGIVARVRVVIAGHGVFPRLKGFPSTLAQVRKCNLRQPVVLGSAHPFAIQIVVGGQFTVMPIGISAKFFIIIEIGCRTAVRQTAGKVHIGSHVHRAGKALFTIAAAACIHFRQIELAGNGAAVGALDPHYPIF